MSYCQALSANEFSLVVQCRSHDLEWYVVRSHAKLVDATLVSTGNMAGIHIAFGITSFRNDYVTVYAKTSHMSAKFILKMLYQYIVVISYCI